LHAVTNPETFDEIPSNTYGLATSVFSPSATAVALSISFSAKA